MRVPVAGGPQDGADVARAGAFRWISGAGGHNAPGPGRSLYIWRQGHYVYAGADARWCEPCGSALTVDNKPLTKNCPLCGRHTTPAHQPVKEEV